MALSACKEIALKSMVGRKRDVPGYTTHEMSGNVTSVTLVKELPLSRRRCKSGNYGWLKHIVFAFRGCQGIFKVCYHQDAKVPRFSTDPPVPVCGEPLELTCSQGAGSGHTATHMRFESSNTTYRDASLTAMDEIRYPYGNGVPEWEPVVEGEGGGSGQIRLTITPESVRTTLKQVVYRCRAAMSDSGDMMSDDGNFVSSSGESIVSDCITRTELEKVTEKCGQVRKDNHHLYYCHLKHNGHGVSLASQMCAIPWVPFSRGRNNRGRNNVKRFKDPCEWQIAQCLADTYLRLVDCP